MSKCDKVKLSELIIQKTDTEQIVDMENEHYITLSLYGKGARERVIKDGKYPVPFTGYRVSSGQFIYSRIDARNGAYAIIGPELDGFVVSKDFPVFDINESKVLPHFLRRAVLSDAFINQVKNSSFGATNRMRIKEEVFETYSIPLPELSKQNEIVDIMDRVETIINSRQQELQKLDDLIKARFVELFGDPVLNSLGWEKKRFDSLCENFDGRRKPITSTDRIEGPYPYYGASGVVDHVADYIFDEDILLVSEDGANLLARSTPIAFSVSGRVWVNNHAHVVKFDDFALQKYVEYYFAMISIEDYVTGSTQPKLNQAKLNGIMIPIPEKERIDCYLDFIKQVDKSKLLEARQAGFIAKIR